MTYTEAIANYYEKLNDYNNAVASKEPQKKITRYSGRLIAALEVATKAAKKEGHTSLPRLEAELKNALKRHKDFISKMDLNNRTGKYSIVKELGLGLRGLVNSVKMRVHATTQDEKKDANKAILSSVGKNLKNVVKAPIALTTRILKSSIVATVLFAPISLGLGILHAAWECMDSSKSPYEGKTVAKMSGGFMDMMTKLNSKVQKI